MEDFHQQAERGARQALGPACYDAEHEAGACQMRRQLGTLALGVWPELRVPF
jgi:hypothetical protein